MTQTVEINADDLPRVLEELEKMNGQLPLFEGQRPDKSRLTITAAVDDENHPELPGSFKLGELVTVLVTGRIKKVTHAKTKDGTIERQHVLVVEAVSFGEQPPA